MTQEKSRPQNEEAAAVASDPTLNKEAVDEVVAQYEESARSTKQRNSIQPLKKN
jgi:hypothetical protein